MLRKCLTVLSIKKKTQPTKTLKKHSTVFSVQFRQFLIIYVYFFLYPGSWSKTNNSGSLSREKSFGSGFPTPPVTLYHYRTHNSKSDRKNFTIVIFYNTVNKFKNRLYLSSNLCCSYFLITHCNKSGVSYWSV